MDAPDRAFIFLSREIQALLADNAVDLVKQLGKDGLDIRSTRALDPAGRAGPDQAKSPELVILSVAASMTTVALGIARIIDALGRNKKVLVTQRRCVPVLDGTGKPVLTTDGQPILQWVDEAHLLEASNTGSDQSAIKMGLGGDKGLSFELTTSREK